MNDFDLMLKKAIRQAERLGIPVSDKISPHIVINKRAVRRFGCCKKQGETYIIELSEILADAPEISCMQTIAHELIHTCPGCMNHGETFKKYADKMNREYGYEISRTNSRENMGVKEKTPCRYLIICQKCGKRIERVKRSPLVDDPSAYRCQCGGKLIPSGYTPVGRTESVAYAVMCKKCGAEMERKRMTDVIKYPSRYRCSCGGSLVRIK